MMVVVYEAPYEVTSINQHLLRVRQDYVGKQGKGRRLRPAGRGKARQARRGIGTDHAGISRPSSK